MRPGPLIPHTHFPLAPFYSLLTCSLAPFYSLLTCSVLLTSYLLGQAADGVAIVRAITEECANHGAGATPYPHPDPDPDPDP